MKKDTLINYVELPCRDLPATKAFFAAVFNWTFTDEQQDMVLSHQIFIDSKPHYYHFAEQTTNLTGEEVFAAVTGEKP